jgi:hypothetical protein
MTEQRGSGVLAATPRLADEFEGAAGVAALVAGRIVLPGASWGTDPANPWPDHRNTPTVGRGRQRRS